MDQPSTGTDALVEARVVVISGEIDLAVADDLRATLTKGVDSSTALVIDMSEVTFIDSTGISALVAAARRARERGGWIRLAGPQRSPRRVLTIAGVDSLLPIYDTVDEAVAADDS